MLIYKKGDMFSEYPKQRILAHACNCQGQWGAGIALEFKSRFPEIYSRYQNICVVYKKKLLGQGMIVEDGLNFIGCLFTSFGYGKKKDSEKQILENTKKAVMDLLINIQVSYCDAVEIHTPKLNAGLFGVKWEKTEAIIKECLIKYPKVTWVVWTLDK